MQSLSWDEDLLVSKVDAMRTRETSKYNYASYVRQPLDQSLDVKSESVINIRTDIGCREKICHWTYSVVDHFKLSRETVAISMDLFDRFLATQGNLCTSQSALLASLTTLYIAIKVNEKKNIKISTLVSLSRNQFTAKDIEAMEMKILQDVGFLVQAPTAVEFIGHLISFLHADESLLHHICELSRYVAELSICDSFFVDQEKSAIALAAILNVLEDDVSYEKLPRIAREHFLHYITNRFNWFIDNAVSVNGCRDRLRHLKWEQEEKPRRTRQPNGKNRAQSPTSAILESR